MSERCAICGHRPATTKDHVPPKNLFPKPRPQDLVTVPACCICNNHSSVEDEDFRSYLSLQIGKQSELTKKLWLQSKKSIERRTTMRKSLLDSLKTVATKQGERLAFQIPDRVYKVVFERVMRGLYFHHFGEILGEEVPVAVTPLTGIDDQSLKEIQSWPTYSMGTNAFVYKVHRALESPTSTAWVMQLYESHWVLGETGEDIQI